MHILLSVLVLCGVLAQTESQLIDAATVGGAINVITVTAGLIQDWPKAGNRCSVVPMFLRPENPSQ